MPLSRLLQNRWAKRVSEEVSGPVDPQVAADLLPALLPDAINPRYIYVADPQSPSQLALGLIVAMQRDTGRHHRRV